MARGKGRRLGPEERELWEQVASSIIPIARRPAETALPRSTVAEPKPDREKHPRAQINGKGQREGQPPRPQARVSISLAPPEIGPVSYDTPGLDRRTATRLRKGARAPDARIDLHGMTAERAHGVCLRFLADSLRRGCRLVLVITGKGRRREDDGIMGGGGVLRYSLPGWLRASPLGHSIVGIYQAAQRHGGEGAFYVYLKRQR